ncbi:MAG: glutaredoxin 3 [Zoogloeaceae bacterium]|nr:glutaredoxin 3 [Rhodocyclaceae bacterium]MCP5234602.1 glutaredoxin 3 [Zoogloeaceae bacterium]
MSARVRMYATATCPFCMRAEALLRRKGADIEKIRVDLDPSLRDEMIALSGRRTVPQIFIDGRHVGGCDDLYELDHAGGLDPLLAGTD